MTVSTGPLDFAARDVVAAAIAYIESPVDVEIGEGKDLYLSLESAVVAYRLVAQAESASADRTVGGESP